MKATQLARHIINSCVVYGKPINNLRLNLMMYLLQKDHLQKQQRALFNDEVLVGKAFPIIADVYQQYCHYGSLPILRVSEECVAYSEIIDNRISFYNELTTRELHSLATKNSGAWALYKKHYPNDTKIVIPNEIIATRG